MYHVCVCTIAQLDTSNFFFDTQSCHVLGDPVSLIRAMLMSLALSKFWTSFHTNQARLSCDPLPSDACLHSTQRSIIRAGGHSHKFFVSHKIIGSKPWQDQKLHRQDSRRQDPATAPPYPNPLPKSFDVVVQLCLAAFRSLEQLSGCDCDLLQNADAWLWN